MTSTKKWWLVTGSFLVLVSAAGCGDMSKYRMGPYAPSAATGEATGGASDNVPPPGAQAMSTSSFEALMADVKNESFANKQLAAIERAAGSSYFTASQVGQLTTLLTLAGNRKRVVEICAGRILDLDNPSALTGQLTFAAEKTEAESTLRSARERRQAAQAKLDEEQRKRQAEQATTTTTGSQPSGIIPTGGQTSGTTGLRTTSSASCCLGDKFNACDDGAAASACMGWGMCFMRCLGESGCSDRCSEQNPDVRRCHPDASRDAECKK